MGGGYYAFDVAMAARSSNRNAFSYQGYGTDADQAAGRRQVHAILNPYGKIRECANESAIVVALDVTRSRGDDTKIIYEKLPTFIGQLEMKGYLGKPAISFSAVGDANSDQAPLQAGQFERDNRLDQVLTSFWIEEGGGGTGQESYELCAYYFARHSVLECNKHGRKGYFFFVGDEGFYPSVKKDQVKSVLGREIPGDVDSKMIFKELQEKFHTFLIYPRKSFEERKADIDAEIQQRVEAAGGQYKNVDVRASLIWNNRNDLDLHVVPPSGEEIYYAHKQSGCGGWLDVDMNVQGETQKPVENVRWAKGSAPKGVYKIFVQNYRFHESADPTTFRVEVEVNGKIERFEKTISPKGETGAASDVPIVEFTFDPATRHYSEAEEKDRYAKYDDSVVKDQWASVIPRDHILLIDNPASIIDVMLGVMALMEGKTDLAGFMAHLKEGEHTAGRLEAATRALEGLSRLRGPAAQIQMGHVDGDAQNRGGGTRRL